MVRISGLMVIAESLCDGCGKAMKHFERYAYVCEDDETTARYCAECSRERGYLKRRKDEKGQDIETFL